MAKAFTLTAALVVSLCVSNVLSVPLRLDLSRFPPSLPDDKTVRKNFDFLVGLIHNNPKWVTKILVQIKKEMQLRDKVSAKSGLICISCIMQFHYNYSDNDQPLSPEEPHLWNEVLAENAEGPIQQPTRYDFLKSRQKRSLPTKRRSNDSQGSNTTTTATPSTIPAAQNRNGASNLTTPRPPSPKSTSNTPQTTVPTVSSTTKPHPESRFGKFAEKDRLGRAILNCDEENERTYCLHNGKCIIVKILELKSCS